MLKFVSSYKTNIPSMKHKLCITLLMLMFCGIGVSAQDPHFSQFFEAPLLRNPSLAGLFEGDIRVQSV